MTLQLSPGVVHAYHDELEKIAFWKTVREKLRHTSPLTAAYDALVKKVEGLSPTKRVAANIGLLPAHAAMDINKAVSKKYKLHVYPKRAKPRHYDLDVKTGKKTYVDEMPAVRAVPRKMKKVAAAFLAELEKIGFIGVGGGHVALGHRAIPAHLQAGYYNLLGVIPIPDVNLRVGGEALGFSVGPTSIGVDTGVPQGTHVRYRPGLPGFLLGSRGRTWTLRKRKEKK
jgi:hypothetical protein